MMTAASVERCRTYSSPAIPHIVTSVLEHLPKDGVFNSLRRLTVDNTSALKGSGLVFLIGR